MLQNLMEGSVDFIWSGISMVPERFPYMDFLQPLSNEYAAIFIPSHEKREIVDWKKYLRPYSTKLWLVLLATTVGFSTFISILHWIHLKNKPVSLKLIYKFTHIS